MLSRKIHICITFFILTLCQLFVISKQLNAQSDDKMRAMWINNISEGVTWADEAAIETYKIGVYSSTKGTYNELIELAKTRKLKARPVEIIYFNKIKSITQVNILFVDNDALPEISLIYEKIKGKNTLLITDRCADAKYFMINLMPLHEGKKRFEINKQNASFEGFIISNKLLVFGGSEVDLRNIYRQTELELNEKKAKLDAQRAEMNRQEALLEQQKKDIVAQKAENAKQTQEIKEQSKKIEAQKQELKSVFDSLLIQQEKLKINMQILDKQEKKMNDQQSEVEARNDELKKKAKEIAAQDDKIKFQRSTLAQYTQTIASQQFVMYGFGIFIFLILCVAALILVGYTQKKKANKLLEEKNIAINKQKEELLTQAKQLELLNKELEKLSIVASKTHNAVTIMSPDGNFEWVNAGFTIMYGYTLQLLTQEKDENIANASGHSEIKAIVTNCVNNRETIIYESQNTTRTGDRKWVQTTLTPILDDEQNVVKLVAIDADISKLKEAEDKITKQTKQLELTNRELEKLSIVASETDNAVIIMDEAGNFEWVNDAYTKMFGHTFEELVNNVSKNIIGVNTEKHIRELVSECLSRKKTVYYEFLFERKDFNKIWVQSTLTPILDKTGKISKLVAIDTDITKQKMAEQEIRQKNEELSAQKEELEIQKGQIELQNKNIKSSILYALTIQKAILPLQSDINYYFDNFLIYKPKDIVSGDFYWFSAVSLGDKFKTIFVAVVDCTGHGVPGAFMSMIGSRLLGEIVNERTIYSPCQILTRVDDEIKQILKQSESENNDGMDVCLCSIEKQDKDQQKVTFSGAKRPLYYYTQKDKKIESLKGDRKSIGGVRAKRNVVEFTNTELMLEKGDMFYLTTDGIIDQNAPDRKRYGTERFLEILEKNASKPLSIQKEIIETDLAAYQQNEEQRDDITIVGIKL